MPKILSVGSKHQKVSKGNLFRIIWNWFLSLDKLSKLFTVTILLITVATPSVVTSYLIFNPKTATTPPTVSFFAAVPYINRGC